MENAIHVSSVTMKTNILQPFLEEIQKVLSTIKNHQIWLYIAWNDLKSRYRRTILGPFWLVLANAIVIIGMALIWSIIFHMELKEYFPKLTAAMICWSLISYTIIESAGTFVYQGAIIQNLPVSIYLHPLRLIARNVITFTHNLLIFGLVSVFFGITLTRYTVLFIPFIILIIINFFTLSFILGIIGARYRDFPQVLTAAMSIVIYVTPVMWDLKMLGNYYLLVYLNPLTHLLFVIKMPLLGECPPLISVLFVITVTIINCCIMIVMARKYGHRIAYWV